MHLVDTSAWIDFLRGQDTRQVKLLSTLLEGDEVVGIAPIILQEILQGADSPQRFEKWLRYLAGLHCYVSDDPVATHIAAARLYQHCRRGGKTPRSSNDCLIAQIAIDHELVLLHSDRDFEVIAAIAPALRLQPAT